MANIAAFPPTPSRGPLTASARALVGNPLWIAVAALLPVALAVAYLLLIPGKYIASTEILLDPRGLQVVQNDIVSRADSNESAISSVESQIRVLLSEAILRAAVARLNLDSDPEFVGPGRLDALRKLFGTATPEEPRMRALRHLQQAVDARRASRSYVIVVSVRSVDPIKASRIADAVATVYIEEEVRARAAAAQRAGASMTARLQELADRVRNSEEAAEQFKAQSNLVGAGGRLVSEQQLLDLSGQLILARTKTAEQRARLEQIERVLKNGADQAGIAEAVQSQTIAALRAQYAEVTRQEGGLSALLGARHPAAVAVKEEAERYQKMIAAEVARIAEAARNDYARALASEQALNTELERLKAVSVRSSEAMVRLRELERVAESNRVIYAAYLVRAKELGEQGGVDTSNTRVIAVALTPDRPSGPRGTLVLFAIIAGIGLGSILLWLRRRPLPPSPAAA